VNLASDRQDCRCESDVFGSIITFVSVVLDASPSVKVVTELQLTIEAMLRAVSYPVTDERYIPYQFVVSLYLSYKMTIVHTDESSAITASFSNESKHARSSKAVKDCSATVSKNSSSETVPGTRAMQSLNRSATRARMLAVQKL